MLKGKRATSDNAAATKGNGCKKLVTLKMWLITLLMKASPLGSKKKKKKKHLATCTSKLMVIRCNSNH